MNTKDVNELWINISACIADEISTNEEFARKINASLSGDNKIIQTKKSNRRSPAKLSHIDFSVFGDFHAFFSQKFYLHGFSFAFKTDTAVRADYSVPGKIVFF